MLRYVFAILAYVVPTFALGYFWHLSLFQQYYADLQIYRSEIIVPFGFLAILIQAITFAWIYEKAFAGRGGTWLTRGVSYAVLGGILSWSFTTLTVAAKNLMASVPDYLLIETAFTLVQWIIVGPLTAVAFAWAGASRSKPIAT